MKQTQIQLETASILDIPFKTYANDFSFIVNGDEFKTSRIASEILSPKICKIHSIDPTIDKFTLTTKNKGNFSYILDLLNFSRQNIPDDQLPFVFEVLNILNNNNISVYDNDESEETSLDNIFTLIAKHCQNKVFNSKRLSSEIDFISSHFYELCDTNRKQLSEINLDTLYEILSNPKLFLKDEDQLLKFVNELYSKDREYSILYDLVNFSNASSASVSEFISIFNPDDITNMTWIKLSNRLTKEVNQNDEKDNEIEKERYKIEKDLSVTFSFTEDKKFSGIINHILTNEGNNAIEFSASSCHYGNNEVYLPHVVSLFKENSKYFISKNEPGSWLCIDFEKLRIIPTDYTIRSNYFSKNASHMKNWVIETSNDKNNWNIIDEQKDCSYLNEPNACHTFKIQKPISQKVRYIRIRENGSEWAGQNYLMLESFEIYGKLI